MGQQELPLHNPDSRAICSLNKAGRKLTTPLHSLAKPFETEDPHRGACASKGSPCLAAQDAATAATPATPATNPSRPDFQGGDTLATTGDKPDSSDPVSPPVATLSPRSIPCGVWPVAVVATVAAGYQPEHPAISADQVVVFEQDAQQLLQLLGTFAGEARTLAL